MEAFSRQNTLGEIVAITQSFCFPQTLEHFLNMWDYVDYWHKIPVTNLDLFNGMCLIKPSQISDNKVVYFYKIIQVLYLIQVIRYRSRKKQTKKPAQTDNPSNGIDIVLNEPTHRLSLSPWIIDPCFSSFRGLHSPPPCLWSACHSSLLGAKLIRLEKRRVPLRSTCDSQRVETKRSRIGFHFENASLADGKPIRCAVGDTWSSSVFCVIDQHEWLSVSRGNYIVISRFRLIY